MFKQLTTWVPTKDHRFLEDKLFNAHIPRNSTHWNSIGVYIEHFETRNCGEAESNRQPKDEVCRKMAFNFRAKFRKNKKHYFTT
eukprot:scaffold12200_cov122-Cylindrotheca_fusiformis.AAC.8